MSIRLFSMHLQLSFVLLALADAGLLLISPYLALSLGSGILGLPLVGSDAALLPAAVIFALFCLISLFAVGLYSTRLRCSREGVVVRVVAAITNSVVLSALVYYFLPELAMSRGTLAIAAAIAAFSCLTIRALSDHLLDENLFKRRVLVFGAGRRAACLGELRRRTDTRGFRLVAFIAADGDHLTVSADRLMERPADLHRWSLENQIDEIVVAMDDRRRAFPAHEFLECRLSGIPVTELSVFLEREAGKVRLAALSPSSIIFGEGFEESDFKQWLLRGFDVLVSIGLLVAALPVMSLTALAIILEEGWRAPVLFRQRRVGRYGKPFNVLKFRSMRVDAERDGAVWAAPDDSRNTRVGRFIRKVRIDELPQLINVLRGEMSLVGPRPERPEFVEQLEQALPYYRGRHVVRPGITGWAQLCYPYGANEKDALEKLQYDLYYVKHRSLLFYLMIILQTVEVVLWQKGAR